jgi:hypothetical protein
MTAEDKVWLESQLSTYWNVEISRMESVMMKLAEEFRRLLRNLEHCNSTTEKNQIKSKDLLRKN